MQRARLKAMLVALENQLQSGMVVGEKILDASGDKLNIDHVMPQTWATNWPLARDAGELEELRRSDAIHRLGNLTLATPSLNPTMSNKAWSEKRPLLQSHSLVRLTTASILASPDPGFTDEEWTSTWDEERIEKRTQVLAALAQETWPGPPREAPD